MDTNVAIATLELHGIRPFTHEAGGVANTLMRGYPRVARVARWGTVRDSWALTVGMPELYTTSTWEHVAHSALEALTPAAVQNLLDHFNRE